MCVCGDLAYQAMTARITTAMTDTMAKIHGILTYHDDKGGAATGGIVAHIRTMKFWYGV